MLQTLPKEMNCDGQNGDMEQQDHWNWLCSPGAISLHPEVPKLHTFIFLVFLVALLVNIMMMVILIWLNSNLHVLLCTFFSSQLSLMDLLYISTFVPKRWPLTFCLDETTFPILIVESSSFLFSSWGAECMAVMALGSYVAICHPCYSILMCPRVSFSWWLALGWIALINAFVHVVYVLNLPFVAPVHHFFCEIPALLETCLCWHFSLWKWSLSVVVYFSSFQYHHGLIYRFSPDFTKLELNMGMRKALSSLFFPYDCSDSFLWNCHHQIFSPQILSL